MGGSRRRGGASLRRVVLSRHVDGRRVQAGARCEYEFCEHAANGNLRKLETKTGTGGELILATVAPKAVRRSWQTARRVLSATRSSAPQSANRRRSPARRTAIRKARDCSLAAATVERAILTHLVVASQPKFRSRNRTVHWNPRGVKKWIVMRAAQRTLRTTRQRRLPGMW